MTEHRQCDNESHDADLIAARGAAIALVQHTNTHATCDGTIDRISDEIPPLGIRCFHAGIDLCQKIRKNVDGNTTLLYIA